MENATSLVNSLKKSLVDESNICDILERCFDIYKKIHVQGDNSSSFKLQNKLKEEWLVFIKEMNIYFYNNIGTNADLIRNKIHLIFNHIKHLRDQCLLPDGVKEQFLDCLNVFSYFLAEILRMIKTRSLKDIIVDLNNFRIFLGNDIHILSKAKMDNEEIYSISNEIIGVSNDILSRILNNVDLKVVIDLESVFKIHTVPQPSIGDDISIHNSEKDETSKVISKKKMTIQEVKRELRDIVDGLNSLTECTHSSNDALIKQIGQIESIINAEIEDPSVPRLRETINLLGKATIEPRELNTEKIKKLNREELLSVFLLALSNKMIDIPDEYNLENGNVVDSSFDLSQMNFPNLSSPSVHKEQTRGLRGKNKPISTLYDLDIDKNNHDTSIRDNGGICMGVGNKEINSYRANNSTRRNIYDYREFNSIGFTPSFDSISNTTTNKKRYKGTIGDNLTSRNSKTYANSYYERFSTGNFSDENHSFDDSSQSESNGLTKDYNMRRKYGTMHVSKNYIRRETNGLKTDQDSYTKRYRANMKAMVDEFEKYKGTDSKGSRQRRNSQPGSFRATKKAASIQLKLNEYYPEPSSKALTLRSSTLFGKNGKKKKAPYSNVKSQYAQSNFKNRNTILF